MFERWPSRCILALAGVACVAASWVTGRKLEELTTHGQFATVPRLETTTRVTSAVAASDAAHGDSEAR